VRGPARRLANPTLPKARRKVARPTPTTTSNWKNPLSSPNLRKKQRKRRRKKRKKKRKRRRRRKKRRRKKNKGNFLR